MFITFSFLKISFGHLFIKSFSWSKPCAALGKSPWYNDCKRLM